VMQVSWGARSDLGLRRSTNEDSFCGRADLGLFVVADGMGGHVAGEVASRVAVDEIQRFVETSTALGPHDTWPVPFDRAFGRDGNRLRAGFDLANRRIAARIEEDRELGGMATTAVALLVAGSRATLAHVGDSRAYSYRTGTLTRLTRDHSWVEEQMMTGMLTRAEAREHPWRNIVTRALSGTDGVEVEVTEVEFKPGDRLLLSSDGLTTVLADEEIGAVLAGSQDLQGVCNELVRRTNAAGGPDNVTTLMIELHAT